MFCIRMGFPLGGWWDGEWGCCQPSSSEISLMVNTCNNTQERIWFLSVHQTEKVMGVEQAPDGNHMVVLGSIAKKNSDFLVSVKNGHLTRRSTWIAYDRCHWPSVKYPLPATDLSCKECSELDKDFTSNFCQI